MQRDEVTTNNISKGGYILYNNTNNPDIIILATGSEVELAYKVYTKLVADGEQVRLVSMPSTSVFDTQNIQYKNSVLSNAKYKIAIEAGVADSWYKYVGNDGLIISIDTFGESAPAKDLFNHFGFTEDNILDKIKDFIKPLN